jgi:hypothetical protein
MLVQTPLRGLPFEVRSLNDRAPIERMCRYDEVAAHGANRLPLQLVDRELGPVLSLSRSWLFAALFTFASSGPEI